MHTHMHTYPITLAELIFKIYCNLQCLALVMNRSLLLPSTAFFTSTPSTVHLWNSVKPSAEICSASPVTFCMREYDVQKLLDSTAGGQNSAGCLQGTVIFGHLIPHLYQMIKNSIPLFSHFFLHWHYISHNIICNLHWLAV